MFLYEKEQSQTVVDTTLESYRSTITHVVTPACGNLPLRDLTVLRCNRILLGIWEEKSLPAARRARSILSQVCQTGIEHEVIAANPIRDARRLPLPDKKESVLSPDQVMVVHELMRGWRADGAGFGPRPNVAVLENVMWIMIGTSARIGEVLGLRRCDVDVTARPATVLIAGTIKQSKVNGLYRKNTPKRSRQKRRIALPSFAAAAVRVQLAEADRDPEAFLFSTKTGRPFSVSNYERLLRTFIDDNEKALQAAAIDTGEFSTHIFRRTTATIIDAAAGITLASRLLGHANEQVTRHSYVVTAELVDPVTADIMENAFAASSDLDGGVPEGWE
ncbi:tyrosine-type recombinase/integrase [Microbacterium hominis]|uniref:tyrosine-type recombinase/integrase n=1 Tax=Microbacterium hominis TaxID=162426 RepID=UPI0020B84EF5|nr:tyrosine-type recombinase/integrase [Microbacterium hominis]